MAAEHAVQAQQCFQLVAVEVLFHDVVHIDQDNTHEIAHVLLAQQLEAQAELEQRQPVSQVGLDQFGRAGLKDFRQQLRVLPCPRVEDAVGFAIGCGHLVALDTGTLQGKVPTLGVEQHGGKVPRSVLQSVVLQGEFAADIRV